MRLSFQNRQMLLALLGGAPATLIVATLAWVNAPTPGLRIVGIALTIGFWLACGFALRRRLVFPLQALANLVEAVRCGDYTLRGRRAQPGDALGEVVRELNSLGATLQAQRLASIEATQLMQTVVAELDQAVFAFDAERRLRLVNRTGAELLGRAAEALIGRPAADLGLEELLGQPDASVRALAFPGRSGRFEVRRREFREAGLPHTLLMVSDLSRALREEERRSWQRLIRVIGHEINNSLTPIKSLAGTLRDMMAVAPAADPGPTMPPGEDAMLAVPERADMLEGLSLIGDRADSLSKFVATYSQLARLPAPTKSSVSLNALLQRLVAAEPFAAVQLEAPFEIRLPADAGQLEQVFINLLKNAIEAARERSGGVEVLIERTREAALVEVRDCGPGIANPENLFVPFFTTKPGGSGIGLTLSRQIVEAHGGTLTLENRADRGGAIARVTLPVADAGAPATSARTSA